MPETSASPTEKPLRPAWRGALRSAASAALVLLAVAAVRHAFLAFGAALRGTSNRVAQAELLGPIAALAACVFGVSLAAYLLARLRAGLAPILIALFGATAILVPRYLETIEPQRAYDFHGILTIPPSQRWTDQSPFREHITYRINAFGFRGPDFAEAKAPGVLRVVLAGDSFTFGQGVEEADTLAGRLDALLAARGLAGRVEIVSAAVCGTNLPTHIRMYEAARRHLGADAVVMSVFVWNDLAAWDWQDERRGLSRPSGFGLLSWLLGYDPATILMTRLFVQHGDEARSLRVLDDLLPRLRAALADPGAPPLIAVAHMPDARVEERLRALPHTDVIAAPTDAANYIPGDGHPNGRGNAVVAERVLDRLLALPAFRALAAR